MSKIKLIMWVVVDDVDVPFTGSVNETEATSIAKFYNSRNLSKTWEELKEDGYCCIEINCEGERK